MTDTRFFERIRGDFTDAPNILAPVSIMPLEQYKHIRQSGDIELKCGMDGVDDAIPSGSKDAEADGKTDTNAGKRIRTYLQLFIITMVTSSNVDRTPVRTLLPSW